MMANFAAECARNGDATKPPPGIRVLFLLAMPPGVH